MRERRKDMEIKKIRESRGMLQYELANRMGVKQASVSAWESGKAMPSAENLLKLADILECTVDALLGRAPASA
jgi:transcriptional regulator with XRE-family HTH domain